MKLFHWRAQQIDFFVMAESVEAARAFVVDNIHAVQWQNTERFQSALESVEGAPYYEADAGHVIAIDRSE